MKLTIEITEEDAACIWANHHSRPVAEIVEGILKSEAAKYRQAYPGAVSKAVADFKTKGAK